MIDVATMNEPAFKARLAYFQTEDFNDRFERMRQKLQRGERPGDRAFWKTLGCTEAEMAAWLTIVDALDALDGREPQHGFPALRKRANATVEVKTAPNGELLDFRFIEWAPGVAPATSKETIQ